MNELPPELEDLFTHILNRIEKRYQLQAAKLLMLCTRAHEVSMGLRPLYTLGLAIMESRAYQVSLVFNDDTMSEEMKYAKCQMLEERFLSRCCGLLETSEPPAWSQTCFAEVHHSIRAHDDPRREHCRLIDSHVEVLHRSIFEFLSDPAVWRLDCLALPDDFDAKAVLCNSSLCMAYLSADQERNEVGRPDSHFFTSGQFVRHAFESRSQNAQLMAKSFSRCVMHLAQFRGWTDCVVWNGLQAREVSDPTEFTQELNSILLLHDGMLSALRQLKAESMHSTLADLPPAEHAAGNLQWEELLATSLQSSEGNIKFFLKEGSDPNKRFPGNDGAMTTSWELWLRLWRGISAFVNFETVVVMERFLEAGADLTTPIKLDTGAEKLPRTIIRDLINRGMSKPEREHPIHAQLWRLISEEHSSENSLRQVRSSDDGPLPRGSTARARRNLSRNREAQEPEDSPHLRKRKRRRRGL